MKHLILLLVAGLGITGCKPQVDSPSPRVVRLQDWAPDQLPYAQGRLVLSGTSIPVAVHREARAGEFSLRVVAHGKTLEEERYLLDERGLRLAYAAGEVFDPPLTLVRSPMTVGDSWNWGGDLRSGLVGIPAKARVFSTMENLNAPGGPFDALRIDVQLRLGEGEPVLRELRFWFARGRGLVRREFGTSSTREPSGD